MNQSKGAEPVSIYEMKGDTDALWADRISGENECAVKDRKSVKAGGPKYLNFIAFVLRKKQAEKRLGAVHFRFHRKDRGKR